MVEIYERVFETVFDEKQNGYLQSGRLEEDDYCNNCKVSLKNNFSAHMNL